MKRYEYRYQAARGLERREPYSCYWDPVNGAVLERMTSQELRACADAMDEAKREERKEHTDER